MHQTVQASKPKKKEEVKLVPDVPGTRTILIHMTTLARVYQTQVKMLCHSATFLSAAIFPATPIWFTLRFLRALTKVLHVGTPLLITWSSLSSHAAIMSSLNVRESIMFLM